MSAYHEKVAFGEALATIDRLEQRARERAQSEPREVAQQEQGSLADSSLLAELQRKMDGQWASVPISEAGLNDGRS